jgi:signal transduction histidine kinase
VKNAIIHSPRGAHLDVSVHQDGDRAQIVIKDNGPGISAERLATVFQRFSRGAQSRAKCCESTGLGLAIAQSVVQQHGGGIEITSEEGHGTKVRVSWPIRIEGSENEVMCR